MTALITFSPVPSGPFSFQATLDGQVYNCTVGWNIAGYNQQGQITPGRYYVSIYDLSGNRILTIPMIGSPIPVAIASTAGSFAVAVMTWTTINGGQVAVVLSKPGPFQLGSVVLIQGATNSGSGGDSLVNGSFLVNTWSDPQDFTFLLPAASGAVGTIGGTITASPTTAALTWFDNVATALTTQILPYKVGGQVMFTIAGCAPAAYNGRFLCTVTSKQSFTYALSPNPGAATSIGTYSPDLNLTQGYFNSTIVWRPSSGQFEVNP